MEGPKKIPIFGLEDASGTERGLFKKPAELRFGRSEVDASVLRERISHFLDGMREVLIDAPETVGGFHVESVVVTAEISAKGSVSLLGTGGEVAGKGGISFTLKRKPAQT